jgi:diketogulonate reductase-like aldo/keto reductase
MATQTDLLFSNETVATLAKKHNKTAAQIMLRWAVQRGTLPISKSNNPSRMRENRAVYDFYLHREDMEAIDSLNINRRYNDPGVFCELAFGTFCPIYE